MSYCRDVLVNLCHYDKVQSLLSRTSNNSSTVWERSVLTALHQLRDRFPSYPDLVQPFTASMTVVCIHVCTCVLVLSFVIYSCLMESIFFWNMISQWWLVFFPIINFGNSVYFLFFCIRTLLLRRVCPV